jgi:curved DNA-binding protein CbpA
MSQPAPTAKGSLAATPFAHLLIYALDHRLGGTIVFEEPSHAKHAIYFVDGAPARVRAQAQVALLGELAQERGRFDGKTLDACLADARGTGRRLGEVLIERHLLDAEMLEELLQEQVVRRLEFFTTLPSDTVYGYYADTNFLERVGGPATGAPPLGAIWRVIRAGVPAERLRDLLARLGSATLRFHADAPLARFGFGPRERAIVDVLRAKPQPYAELSGRGLVDPSLLEVLVYTFSALRHFDTGSGARPVGSDRASGSMSALSGPRYASPSPRAPDPSPPAAPVSPAPAAVTAPAVGDDPLRRELAERLGETEHSHYEMLGVPVDAPAEVIASAFFQLAKRFHPDRLGPGFDDVRDQATRLFARMTEAHRVLSDPSRRKEYDELLKHGEQGAEDQEEVQRVLRAANSFQKAQVLLKRNSLAAAEVEARQALADDPTQADHVALVAWLEASKPNASLERALSTLNDCVQMEMMNLRVRWYRGQILKRMGQERRAVDDFRFIVERDPRNVDAQREIRLHEMQRGASKSSGGAKSMAPGPSGDAPRARRPTDAPPEKGGFLSKLFKK